ncbi:hypothetical protein SAMN05421839_1186 [Halolactibacillus halophilus]|uniref:Uncharacterized protein n=1 Tax=Halolactibacillus halophilus TaxID=306540 RepID=A0A1I5Q1K0_9BACI|nr:hypothetical protein SAMN05421839_1186 [Halolactibacillus halophilus]
MLVEDSYLNQCKRGRIKSYLNISRKIQQAEQRIKWIDKEFYNQSFVGVTCEFAGDLVYKGFNVEKSIVNHIGDIESFEKKITMLKTKKKYIQSFMESLSDSERMAIINMVISDKPLTEIETTVYQEILEIDEAVNFMQGIEPDKTTDKLENNNINLENDFLEIFNMLEVE